jgi:hypothetical protein
VAFGISGQRQVKRGEFIDGFHQHPVLFIERPHTQNPLLMPLEKVFQRSRTCLSGMYFSGKLRVFLP